MNYLPYIILTLCNFLLLFDVCRDFITQTSKVDIFLVIQHIHIHIQSSSSCSVITGHEHKGKTSLVAFHILQHYEGWQLKQEKSRASHKNKTSPSLRSAAWCSSLKLYLFICAVISHSFMFDSLQPHWLLCPWPTRLPVHGDSPGKNTGVSCHALLQRIFPTQGSNPGLPHCRWIFYRQSHQGSPIVYPNVPKKTSVLWLKDWDWEWGHLGLYSWSPKSYEISLIFSKLHFCIRLNSIIVIITS